MTLTLGVSVALIGLLCGCADTAHESDAGLSDSGSVDANASDAAMDADTRNDAATHDGGDSDAAGEDASTPVCGNGIIEEGEACDGTVRASCVDFGMNAGFPRCTEHCEIDSTTCSTIHGTAFAAYDTTACAVVDAGGASHLTCWGDSRWGIVLPPPTQRLASIRSCSERGWCGVEANGEIGCANVPALNLPEGNRFTDVWCSDSLVVGRTQSGAILANATTPWLAVPDGDGVRDIYPGLQCVWLESGPVQCADARTQELFGSDTQLAVWAPYHNNGAGQRVCGVSASGIAWCRSADAREMHATIPDMAPGYQQVISIPTRHPETDIAHVCALGIDGIVRCDDAWESTFRTHAPAGVAMTKIGAMRDAYWTWSVVGLATDGTLHTWGQGEARSWIGAFTDFSQPTPLELVATDNTGHVQTISSSPGRRDTRWDLGAPPTQVSLSALLGCAAYADGLVRCWGREATPYLTSSVFPPVVKDVFVASGGLDSAICVRDPENIVSCWSLGFPFMPPPTTPIASISHDVDSGCFEGLDADGVVSRWGNIASGSFCRPPPHPDGYSKLAVGNVVLTCGLRFDHTIECSTWLDAAPVLTVPGSDYIDVISVFTTVCGLKASGEVTCFNLSSTIGDFDPGRILASAGDADPVVRFFGNDSVYGVRASGRIAEFILTSALDPWILDGVRRIVPQVFPALGPPRVCMEGLDERVHCDEGPVVTDAPFMERADIALSKLCWTANGDVVCNAAGSLIDGPRPFSQPVSEARVSLLGVCAVLADGSVECEPSEADFSTLGAPAGTGYHNLTAGADSFCVLDASGSPKCWNDHGEFDPGISGPVLELHPGFMDPGITPPTSCAITTEHHLLCTGEITNGMPSDAATSSFVALSMREDVVCATRNSGVATCWGWTASASGGSIFTGEFGLRAGERIVASATAVCIEHDSHAPRCFGGVRY